jgi:hypothetical protein
MDHKCEGCGEEWPVVCFKALSQHFSADATKSCSQDSQIKFSLIFGIQCLPSMELLCLPVAHNVQNVNLS